MTTSTEPSPAGSLARSMSEGLTPVRVGAIRARRRPLAIVMVWLWELFFAMLVATPVHAWARRVWGEHPQGDRVLFEPGGRELLLWLGESHTALPIVARVVLVLLCVSAVLSQVVLGFLVVSLAFERARRRAPLVMTATRAGVTAFLPLASLLVFLALAQGLVLGVGLFVSSSLDPWLTARYGDARSFTIRAAVVAFFAIGAALVGVFGDLARAAIGRDAALDATNKERTAWRTMLLGIRAAMTASKGRGLFTAFFAWAWRAALGALLVAAVAAVVGRLPIDAGFPLVMIAALHQAVVLVRVALRASWLARATERVARVQDAWSAAPPAP